MKGYIMYKIIEAYEAKGIWKSSNRSLLLSNGFLYVTYVFRL